MIEERIKEEVYYREALAMGLDRDDTIVRRRMRQKLEFLMNDLARPVEPTEEELEDYPREHSDQFRSAPRISFSHVYVNRDRRGETALVPVPPVEAAIALSIVFLAVEIARGRKDSLTVDADFAPTCASNRVQVRRG